MTPSRVAERRREDAAAWSLVKQDAEIHVNGLREKTGLSANRAREIIRSWEGRGMIHEQRMEKNMRVFNVGSKAAALDVRRQQIADEMTDDPRRNMWRSMHVLGTFTPLDISNVSSMPGSPVDEAMAERFCQSLLRGEYLRVMEKARPGFRPATYLLARRTGPIPPVERRIKALWDENLGAYTFANGVGVLS